MVPEQYTRLYHFADAFSSLRGYSDSGLALRQRLADGWRRGYVPLLALVLFAIEGWIINPYIYSIYFVGIHGWILGLLCFVLGFRAAPRAGLILGIL